MIASKPKEDVMIVWQTSRWVKIIAASVVFVCFANAAEGEEQRTLYGKHIAGYQGWFSCPTDGGTLGWRHWFRDKASPEDLVVDMWPDVSELSEDELCPTGLFSASGKPMHLFSSRNPVTVRRHFRWMKEYGIDGVALQRFVSEVGSDGPQSFVNVVLNNVRASAEAERRGFFIMYDLSGNDPHVIEKVTRDWTRLTEQVGIQQSSSYMYHRGRPVVGLWGAGLKDRGISAQQTRELIRLVRTAHVPATIVGGVPMYWRALGRDSRQEPEWAEIYRSYDVISPWSVGRLHNESELAAFLARDLLEDMKEAARTGRDYMPVIYAGMSFHNALHGRLPLNNIPRDCGKFYSALGEGVVKKGARIVYTAMFDEVNEGTAVFKVATNVRDTPIGYPLATLGDGSCRASSDLYLRLGGAITELLHRAAAN
jgi:hypothetical protein